MGEATAWGLASGSVCKKRAAAASIGTVLVCALLLVLRATTTNSSTAIRLTPHLYFRGSAKHLLQEQLPSPQQVLEQSQPPHSHSPIGADRLVSGLTYISHHPAASVLGCPVNHSLACFYRFQPDAPELRLLPNSSLVSIGDCATVLEPLPVDHGRPWCIREGREPAWLRRAVPEKAWRHQNGTTLLTGKLDSPNPTHQANLHFLAIWRWMRRLALPAGQLNMLVDHDDPAWSPGKFGAGLANALGSLQWLPLLEPGVVQLERLQFSIPDGEYFPFDLKHHTTDAPVDAAFLELAENVKARIMPSLSPGAQPAEGIWQTLLTAGKQPLFSPGPEQGKDRPPRVLLSRRREADSRIWSNAEDCAEELRAMYGMQSQVVTFGDLSFEDQVRLTASADVLVGITGSDLVNMMFLPLSGSLVEIFPSLDHEQVFVPELGNMARLLGKNHFVYVTTGNLTLDYSQHRLLYKAKRVTVPVADLAALISHAARQAISGSSMQHTECDNLDGVVSCH